jgi:hypothetical protein
MQAIHPVETAKTAFWHTRTHGQLHGRAHAGNRDYAAVLDQDIAERDEAIRTPNARLGRKPQRRQQRNPPPRTMLCEYFSRLSAPRFAMNHLRVIAMRQGRSRPIEFLKCSCCVNFYELAATKPEKSGARSLLNHGRNGSRQASAPGNKISVDALPAPGSRAAICSVSDGIEFECTRYRPRSQLIYQRQPCR